MFVFMCLWSFCKKIFFSTGKTFLPLYPDFYAFQMPFWNFYLFFGWLRRLFTPYLI